MSETAICFQHISKQYRLIRGWTFSVAEARKMARRWLGKGRDPSKDFWALKDVSFEIGVGETIGLIGANGAGKSTVLKILSRVTAPSSGTFGIRGKLGALIELGAGFHPELTGRENVYLNGSIMGMSRAEVKAKFDRILEFAEVEQFIDVPIKRYSSGMMVRLGFAVAAHIDPDILLIDEVLAVGDAAFQAKCLNKLAELKEQQKTIVLVSHIMPNILKHSDRVLWIDHGVVRAFGDPERIAEEYLGAVQERATVSLKPSVETEACPIRIGEVTVRDSRGRTGAVLEYGRPAVIEVAYEVTAPVDHPVVSVTFQDVHGYQLGGLTSRLDGVKLDLSQERALIRLVLSPVVFTRGAYTLTVAIHDERIQRTFDLRAGAATFTVDGPSVSSREVSGHVVYPHRWDVEV